VTSYTPQRPAAATPGEPVHQVPSCRVIVINHVLDTQEVFLLPTPVEEAIDNCQPVLLARNWITFHQSFSPDEPVEACIRRSQHAIQVTWHIPPHADPATARVRMREILAGEGEGCL